MQDSQCNKKYSFGVEQRLSKSVGYGKSLSSAYISNQCYKLFYISNCEKKSRLGIIASKKLMHDAVERNLNKRLIREMFRTHPIRLQAFDLVVQVRKTKSQVSVNQQQKLAELFDKLELQCAQP